MRLHRQQACRKKVLLRSLPLVAGAVFAAGVLILAQREAGTGGQLSAAQFAQGQILYEAQCAACHGPNGEGQSGWQTPAANGIYPAPPHTSAGHTWHHSDQQLLQISAEGGSAPTTTMPGFSATPTRDEMELTLAYIKTLWGPQERAKQEKNSRP